MRSTSLKLFLIGFAIGLVFVHGLGNFPLTERSEARYAGVAWEMLNSGDYLTPRYNGIKHFHKPPLVYWSIAACFRTFGVSELAARVPMTLAAFAVLGLTLWLGTRMDSRRVGWSALILLATSPFFWEMGRIAVTDMLVTFFVVLALASAWQILESKRASWPSFLAFWGSCGLNFLTKGPVGPLIVALVLLPYMVWGRHSFRAFRPLPGLVFAMLIGVPWYGLLLAREPGLLKYFLVVQTVQRVVTDVHHRAGPVWFYLPVVLAGFLPWSLLLPEAIMRAWRSRRQSGVGPFLLLWAILPVLFFSLISSKLPPYILPVFPALALLVARSLPALGKASIGLTLMLSWALSLFCLLQSRFWPIEKLTRFEPELWLAGWWMGGCALLATAMALRRQKQAIWAVLVVAMLGIEGLAGKAISKVEHLSARPLSRAILRRTQGPFEVAMARHYLFGLPYYLGQGVVHVEYARESQFENPSTLPVYQALHDYLPVFRRGDRDRFLVVGQSDWPLLRTLFHEEIIYQDAKFLVLSHPRVEGAP